MISSTYRIDNAGVSRPRSGIDAALVPTMQRVSRPRSGKASSVNPGDVVTIHTCAVKVDMARTIKIVGQYAGKGYSLDTLSKMRYLATYLRNGGK